MPALEDSPNFEYIPMSALMDSFNRIIERAMNSENTSARPISAENLRLHAAEFAQESPLQIRRYANTPNNQVSLSTATRNLFPASGNQVSRGNSASASTVAIRQPARIISRTQRISSSTSTQSDFDPEKFDPTDLSFKETYRTLSVCNLDKYTKFVRDTILKYSLSITGFPDCPDKDLMLAVYFYFEEKFKIKANFELCVRFNNHNQKNVVGVILDSIRTKEEILKKAASSKRSKIKIVRNGTFHWILDGFCEH